MPGDPALRAYLTIGLDELRPDVTFMWINDPDETGTAARGPVKPTRRNAAGSGKGNDRDRPEEESRKGGWTARGPRHARHSRLDAGIEDQAAED
jgi:hypothetical protein